MVMRLTHDGNDPGSILGFKIVVFFFSLFRGKNGAIPVINAMYPSQPAPFTMQSKLLILHAW